MLATSKTTIVYDQQKMVEHMQNGNELAIFGHVVISHWLESQNLHEKYDCLYQWMNLFGTCHTVVDGNLSQAGGEPSPVYRVDMTMEAQDLYWSQFQMIWAQYREVLPLMQKWLNMKTEVMGKIYQFIDENEIV